jgi:hypothetical protein
MSSESPLHDSITIAWRRKWLLIAPTIVGLAISALLLGKLPRVYEAIAPDRGGPGWGSSRRLAGQLGSIADGARPAPARRFRRAGRPQGLQRPESEPSRRTGSRGSERLTLDTYGTSSLLLRPRPGSSRRWRFLRRGVRRLDVPPRKVKTGRRRAFRQGAARGKSARARRRRSPGLGRHRPPDDVTFHNGRSSDSGTTGPVARRPQLAHRRAELLHHRPQLTATSRCRGPTTKSAKSGDERSSQRSSAWAPSHREASRRAGEDPRDRCPGAQIAAGSAPERPTRISRAAMRTRSGRPRSG